ncbi:hypothetical protein N7454_010541 [Penicillium verhagenii]|nr:hypothetical protein N7454_010541 [Penicillium verhagenii]
MENDSGSRPGSPDIEVPELHNRKRILNDSLKRARKRLKGHGSFDLEFWTNAEEVDRLTLERTRIQRKISLQEYDGPENGWKASDEGKNITSMIKAQEKNRDICKQRVEQLTVSDRGSRLRASFVKLFTTSKMGLGITSTGTGSRPTDKQSAFRADMISKYNAQREGEDNLLWCPILGQWHDSESIVAAHLFAYMHGQVTMNAIFGKTKSPELFSPRNGLLISSTIERYMDAGKIVIVPDLPERPKVPELLKWLTSRSRSLKVRLLDPTWEKREKLISAVSSLRYKDLDNRPLVFRSDFRPAARYLYFHYVVQILRRAWQKDSQGGPDAVDLMKDEAGKPLWGTPGRYLPRSMLLALVEEIGHEYKPLLSGASAGGCSEPNLLMAVCARQVGKARPSLRDSVFWGGEEIHDSEEEEDDEDDEDDEDGDVDDYHGKQ